MCLIWIRWCDGFWSYQHDRHDMNMRQHRDLTSVYVSVSPVRSSKITTSFAKDWEHWFAMLDKSQEEFATEELAQVMLCSNFCVISPHAYKALSLRLIIIFWYPYLCFLTYLIEDRHHLSLLLYVYQSPLIFSHSSRSVVYLLLRSAFHSITSTSVHALWWISK